ncbi:hypothetical protein CPB86DRAFT_693379 [Serendipita vermifera]|nr:hypothetical protein CPB86DRAFT_693379 [Serendipita vermifera]
MVSLRNLRHINSCVYGTLSCKERRLLTNFLVVRFLWNSRTGIGGLDRVILRLLTISVESSFPCLLFVLLVNLTVLLRHVSSNFFAYSVSTLYGLSLITSLNCREKIQLRLSQYRAQNAFLNFSNGVTQTNGVTESQVFCEENLETIRENYGIGTDISQHYRRPSLMSFVREILATPPQAKLEI